MNVAVIFKNIVKRILNPTNYSKFFFLLFVIAFFNIFIGSTTNKCSCFSDPRTCSNNTPPSGGVPNPTVGGIATSFYFNTQLFYMARQSNTFELAAVDAQNNISDDTCVYNFSSSDTNATLPNTLTLNGMNSSIPITFASVLTTSPSVSFTVVGIDTSHGTSSIGTQTSSPYLWFEGTATYEDPALTGDTSCAQYYGVTFTPDHETTTNYAALPGMPSDICTENLEIEDENTGKIVSNIEVYEEGDYFGGPAGPSYGSCPLIYDPYWNTGTQPLAETSTCTAGTQRAFMDVSYYLLRSVFNESGGSIPAAWRFAGSIGPILQD
jgi:hypothetical protein